MTCIVAIKHHGQVFMGADSAAVWDRRIVARRDHKLFTVGPMLFGFTTSFRMGQLLAHSLRIPAHDPGIGTEQYLCTTFVDAIRQCLKDGGFATVDRGTESGGTFLVGYEGRIFRISNDYQVGESIDSFDAVGSGEDIALGSLFSTEPFNQDPRARLKHALNAAQRYSNGVRAPFHFLDGGYHATESLGCERSAHESDLERPIK